MTGNEVLKQIKAENDPTRCFIKWWRKDNDFVDFELVNIFIEKVKPSDIFDGFELLSLEQMWNILTDLDPDKLTRTRKGDNEVIEWVWTDKEGKEKANTYPFTPEVVMSILNDDIFT